MNINTTLRYIHIYVYICVCVYPSGVGMLIHIGQYFSFWEVIKLFEIWNYRVELIKSKCFLFHWLFYIVGGSASLFQPHLSNSDHVLFSFWLPWFFCVVPFSIASLCSLSLSLVRICLCFLSLTAERCSANSHSSIVWTRLRSNLL